MEDPEVTPFVRPDPEVLSETIPVFFIGRNPDGIRVARDADGKHGGLFWRKEAALRFARQSAGTAGCATVFPQGRLELDIANGGNSFVAAIVTVKRAIARANDQGDGYQPEDRPPLKSAVLPNPTRNPFVNGTATMTLLTLPSPQNRRRYARITSATDASSKQRGSVTATPWRFVPLALSVLLVTALLAGIFALKTVMFLPYFRY